MVNVSIAFGAIVVMIASIPGTGVPLAVVGREGSPVLVSLDGLHLLRYQT